MLAARQEMQQEIVKYCHLIGYALVCIPSTNSLCVPYTVLYVEHACYN